MGTIASDSIQLESIKDVYDTAEGADTKADTAQATADATAQHFWADEQGAHITEVDRATYEADPANAGGNTLITSGGMVIRDGESALARLSGDGVQVGQDNGSRIVFSPNSVDMLTAEGARFFKIDATNSTIETSATVYAGDAYNISFDNDYPSRITIDDTGIQAGTDLVMTVPVFYVFLGTNNYEITNLTATASEGTVTTVTTLLNKQIVVTLSDQHYTYGTSATKTITITANYDYQGVAKTVTYTITFTYNGSDQFVFTSSHTTSDVITYVARKIASIESEAVYVTTPSLTFGTRSGSEGSLSATLGEGLKSPVDNQTVIGAYNIEDTGDDYAFIIGNGSDDNARSNAFTVDWTGNVEAAGDVSAGGSKCMTVADWTETIIKGGATVTNTNQSVTLNESVNNFAFIRIRLYTSSAAMSVLVNPETILTKVNDTYVPSKYLMRLGTTNHYLQITAVSETQLTIRLESAASNTYCNMWGYGRLAN